MSTVQHVEFVKTSLTSEQLSVLTSCCLALVSHGQYSSCRVILEHFKFESYKDLPLSLTNVLDEETWKKIYPYLRKKHVSCLEMLYIYTMHQSGISLREIAVQIGRSYIRVTQYCKAIEDASSDVVGEQSSAVVMKVNEMIQNHSTLREICRSTGMPEQFVLSQLKQSINGQKT